jgi:hypothetical protein
VTRPLGRAGTGLALALAASAGGAGCNMNEPSYYPAPAPVEIGGPNAGGDPFAIIELPFRPPRTDEQESLREESQRKGFAVPWLRTDNVSVSVLYTITNLGDKPATAKLELDGASEFANYDVIALRAAQAMAAINNEDEIEVLPLLEVAPFAVPAAGQVTGMLREDDFDEAALDLDALARFGAAPATVLVNNSQKNGAGLEALPPEHVRPALYRVRVALVGNGHLRLNLVVRVRDEASQLLTTGGLPFAPNPPAYAPPMMPPAP